MYENSVQNLTALTISTVSFAQLLLSILSLILSNYTPTTVLNLHIYFFQGSLKSLFINIYHKLLWYNNNNEINCWKLLMSFDQE